MEKVKCPNPKCGRRIFDIEEMPPGKVVLEMKCRHCGEIIRVGFSPKMVHKKNRRQESPATLEGIRALMAQKTQEGKSKEIKELLQKYGAVKLSAVKPEDYPALMQEAQVL